MNNWTNIFGGTAVSPADVQYLALALTANTTLVWPLESAEGQNYVARQLDVTPSGANLVLTMPPANEGGAGIVTVATNLGAFSFTFKDNSGNQIVVIAPGESWIVSLTDNSTVAGAWGAIKLGAGAPSGSLSSSLAGNGLQAFGTVLQTRIVTNLYTTNQTLTVGHRSAANIWTGVTGTFTLDPIATVTAGWWTIVSNEGTGILTIATSGGNTIDGQASITLPVSGAVEPYSALIVAAAGGFHTFFLPPIPTPITAGGTGATTAAQALINLGGTSFGISLFTAPSAATVLAALGLPNSIFTELTISTNTVVSTSDSGKSYVCTAALNLSLPQAATVNAKFYIAVYAQGGAVTIVPNGADKINNGALGANLVVSQGSSLLMMTDAASPNGNWWPLFLTIPASGSWAIAGGTANAITATYSPANTALTDGMQLGFRATAANTSTTPTFSPDGLTAHTIVKYNNLPLAPGDIPGNFAECLVRYNLANTSWELLNPAPTSVQQSTWVAAGGTPDAITATYVPAIAALYDGLLLGLRAAAANATTTPTFSPSSLTAHPITKTGGLALTVGDIAGVNHELLLRYNLANTRWELLNPALPPPSSGGGGAGGSGAFAGLKIINGGSPNSQASVTATSVTVATAAGAQQMLAPVSVTPDITVSGANGLDTGSVAASTWYSVWVIWNGTTTAGLFSTSANSPTLPGGYSFSARVGWMRTDASSHLVRTLQYGRDAQYTSPPSPIIATGNAGSITVPTWVAVPLSVVVPTTASKIAVSLHVGGNNTAAMVAPNGSYGAWTSSVNSPPLVGLGVGATGHMVIQGQFVLESTNLFWASQGASNNLNCTGWTDNL